MSQDISDAGMEEEPDPVVAQQFASEHGLEHEHDRHDLTHRWNHYPFAVGRWRRARNVVHGALHGRSITAFEYRYVLLSDDSAERDALRHFLVCVVDLERAVPSLTAVRKDRLAWHGGQLEGQEFPVPHDAWRDQYLLVGEDADFADAVLTEGNAARCLEIEAMVEWRFVNDDFLLWIENARVGEDVSTALEILQPLISAAESFRSA